MSQILCIHGGNSFSSYEAYLNDLINSPIDYERLKPSVRWRDWLAAELPEEYELLTPTFPNGSNAQYSEWVIYFEKLLPFLQDDTTLVGHSLGAMFLIKYLHENTLPIQLRHLVLIAAQYGVADGEDVGSFEVTNAAGISRSAQDVHLFHSEDDFVVPYSSMAKIANDEPAAIMHGYTDQAHFNGPTFPDLLSLIQQK